MSIRVFVSHAGIPLLIFSGLSPNQTAQVFAEKYFLMLFFRFK